MHLADKINQSKQIIDAAQQVAHKPAFISPIQYKMTDIEQDVDGNDEFDFEEDL